MKGKQNGATNDYTVRGKIKAGQEDVPHEPKPSVCEKVVSMNKLSDDAALQFKKLGALRPPVDGPDLSHLPVLGPYRFNDGATYQGQFRSGLRTGWGTVVYPDGS